MCLLQSSRYIFLFPLTLFFVARIFKDHLSSCWLGSNIKFKIYLKSYSHCATILPIWSTFWGLWLELPWFYPLPISHMLKRQTHPKWLGGACVGAEGQRRSCELGEEGGRLQFHWRQEKKHFWEDGMFRGAKCWGELTCFETERRLNVAI
jgi:hypothetical protein